MTAVFPGTAKVTAHRVDPESAVAAQVRRMTPRYISCADPAGIGRSGVGTLSGEEQEEDQWGKVVFAAEREV